MSENKAIGIKELIQKAKEELMAAHDPESPLFAITSVELEISYTVERNAKGEVSFWVITAGAEGKRADVQTVKVTLTPLISAEDIAAGLDLEDKRKAKKALMREAPDVD